MKQEPKHINDYFEGKRSFNNELKVREYFTDDDIHEQVDDVVGEQWGNYSPTEEERNPKLKYLFYELQYKINAEKEQKRIKIRKMVSRFMQVAAIVVPVVLFLGYNLGWLQGTNGYAEQIEVHSPPGTRARFILPDGSTGWMAGGSTLKYPVRFDGDRVVEMAGEVFFDVEKDRNHPFIVKLPDYEVKVLGTQFNVLNYPTDSISEVVVASGRVEVADSYGTYSKVLHPNKMLELNKNRQQIQISEVNAESYTSWIEGRLEFNNDNLYEVVQKIERFYDVDVELNIDGLEDQLFRAKVNIGNLRELLRYMRLTMPIKWSMEQARKDNNGTITKRKLTIEKK
ncbi:DUF4974 domain-containing protein [Puteibacter caeruleilacunae]|nr:DUF4974 domain-containing protein [Puteibacter caeruleilacunae]